MFQTVCTAASATTRRRRRCRLWRGASGCVLAIRERELGTPDSGYLARAREIVAANPRTQATLGALLDIAETLPVRGAVTQVSDDVALLRNQTALQNRELWTAQLRAHANGD